MRKKNKSAFHTQDSLQRTVLLPQAESLQNSKYICSPSQTTFHSSDLLLEMKGKCFDRILINLSQDIFVLFYIPCSQKQLLLCYITKQRALAEWCLQNKDSLKISWHLQSEFIHLRHMWSEFSSTVCLLLVPQEDGVSKCMQ